MNLIKDFLQCKNGYPQIIRIYVAFDILTVVVILLGSFVMLEYSCIYGFSEIIDFLNALDFRYVILNFTVLGVIWSIVAVLCMNVWLSCLLMVVICGAISIINHYVLLFHGMPLSFLMLQNLSTAMNVISGYDIAIDPFVVRMILILVCLLSICILNRKLSLRMESQKKPIKVYISVMAVFLVAFYFCFLGSNPLKPAKTISWDWQEGYRKYGFAACSVESYFQIQNVVNKPEGYSRETVQELEIYERHTSEKQTPDIILILNETLYDLQEITEIKTDIPYLYEMYQLDNVVSGYAITPSIGGGTNSSEYELLTSNSLELMPGITPFNTLDLTGSNSIASYLKSLGYRSFACHSARSSNYSRGIGYPALQFDESFFEPDYKDMDNYYNRADTDESTYINLIRWYENMPESSPRFMYMLTFQNHGAYEQNPPEADLVHVQGDYEEYTQQINEYLTSISLSDKAFCQLTEYFSDVDRPVIICMVGDHAPTFASSIVSGSYSKEEQDLRLRKVPLIYWANYDLESVDVGTMSMNYVVPTLLELAGIELSPYYSYMRNLQERVPILTSYGKYYDHAGVMYSYSDDLQSPYAKVVDDYFFLEYHNLQDDRDQTLFMPYRP